MTEQERNESQSKQISRRDILKMLGGSAAGVSMAKIAGLGGAAAALLQGMPAGAQSRVEVWTGFGQGRMADALTGSLDQFNMSQSEFTAEHIVVPWGEIHDRVIAATSAGSPPDSYRGWSWIVGDAAIGALTNLQPYVEAANVDLMDFWPATLNQMQYQGDVHAMSISTIVQFLYYNKDRMRQGWPGSGQPADDNCRLGRARRGAQRNRRRWRNPPPGLCADGAGQANLGLGRLLRQPVLG